jgi:1,4-dihydroxy-6-naphthoate synthase
VSSPLTLAFSPCPNDTFVFHAWVHGFLPGAPAVEVRYADIDVTNTAVACGELDVAKVSVAALPWLLDSHSLLPCGGAVGRGCGPLVLTPGGSDRSGSRELVDAAELVGATIGVPSERSTAYLLFRLWAATAIPGDYRVRVMPFAEIMPAVRDGEVTAGLVIHEARFTYPNYGLRQLLDLGAWWERDTGLPIPLGAIVARRSVDLPLVTATIRASVAHARANPDASRAYIAHHAQELSQDVQRRHIELYVNDFTTDLGGDGFAAITALLERAAGAGLVPAVRL